MDTPTPERPEPTPANLQRWLFNCAAELRAGTDPAEIAQRLDAVATCVLRGDEAIAELLAKLAPNVEDGLSPGPQTDAMALELWRAYAPTWGLSLEHYDIYVEVCACHDGTGPEQGDDPGRFVPIARGVEVARTIISACQRLEHAHLHKTARPGDVAALELPDEDG